MHVQDTDHSAFITNTYSYKSHYITRSEIWIFLLHSAQYKKVNVSISGLNIFPNEYSGWYENSKGYFAQAALMYISQKLALLIRQMKVFFSHVMTAVC